jgi:hypothetical protein
MSLKAIHIIFIIASSLMMVMFGVWAFREFFAESGTRIHLIYGLVSIVGLAALLVYGRYFLRKLKHISYL